LPWGSCNTRAMTKASHTARIADASPGNWVEAYLPAAALPCAQLMRLDRPIGWWLLVLPCWWGLALAHVQSGGRDVNWWWYAVLFLAGAIIMRGAGCVLNDILDRDIDAQVARTRQRPIPAGTVSVRQALVFLLALCLAGLAVLLQFNWFTVALGAASLLIVAVYPLMKRVTYYPQFVLGLAFNWGALVGWAAVYGSLALAPLLLYAGGVAWTLAYDTIYAHQDKEDDLLIGVKSTALKFGDATAGWLIGFFAAALALIDAAMWIAGASLLAHVAIAAAALHAAWQVARFDSEEPALCLKLFKSNRTFGVIILIGLILDLIFT
jgi:4-hydroxybenzoate polyprenyltransferase